MSWLRQYLYYQKPHLLLLSNVTNLNKIAIQIAQDHRILKNWPDISKNYINNKQNNKADLTKVERNEYCPESSFGIEKLYNFSILFFKTIKRFNFLATCVFMYIYLCLQKRHLTSFILFISKSFTS